MKDGDYIHVQLPSGSIMFGDYHENNGIPFIRSYCRDTGSTRNILIGHVRFARLAGKFNPRNTFAGDVIIYNGGQRVVEAHVGHGVRITVTKNNKTETKKERKISRKTDRKNKRKQQRKKERIHRKKER